MIKIIICPGVKRKANYYKTTHNPLPLVILNQQGIFPEIPAGDKASVQGNFDLTLRSTLTH